MSPAEVEELLQALRNVWPILSREGRRQAIEVADSVREA